MKKLKLYGVEFIPVWPVPSGLIILAYSEKEAINIAKETITHTDKYKVINIPIDKAKVVFYESGEY